jgi:hypothetical protein
LGNAKKYKSITLKTNLTRVTTTEKTSISMKTLSTSDFLGGTYNESIKRTAKKNTTTLYYSYLRTVDIFVY